MPKVVKFQHFSDKFFVLPFKRQKKEYLRQAFSTITTTKLFLKYPALCWKSYNGEFPASFSVHPHSSSVQGISLVSAEMQA